MGRRHLRHIPLLVDGRHFLPPFFWLWATEVWSAFTSCSEILPLTFTSHFEERRLVVKRGTGASGGKISSCLFVLPSALAGESPAKGYSAVSGGVSVGFVQLLERNARYAAMS